MSLVDLPGKKWQKCFTEKENGTGWKLSSTQRKNIREWINEGKIKPSTFIILNWSNRQQLTCNKKGKNKIGDYSLWMYEMNDSDVIRDKKEEVGISAQYHEMVQCYLKVDSDYL